MTILTVLVIYALALTVALALAGHHSRPAPAPPPAGAAGATAVATPPPVRRLLVVGATGGTGRHIVTQALERGHEVTAFVRNPARMDLQHERLRVVRGDVLDHASVEAAMRGQDAVLCALGHSRYFPPNRILSEGTRNILRAMEASGVRRLVCETSLGVGDSAGRMGLSYTFFVVPFILPFYYWDKTRQERLIAASGAEWVIVRPGGLNNGARRGRVRHGFGLGSFLGTVGISRADTAEFMLEQVTSGMYLRTAPAVCW